MNPVKYKIYTINKTYPRNARFVCTAKINVIHCVNSRGKYMIISVDTEESFDEIQHPTIIKMLNKVRRERNFPNLFKDIYQQSKTNIIFW